MRARERRWFRCLRCGLEWYGERSLEVNPDDPVDSAEIIEVHERLADPNLTLGEIVPCHLA